MQNALFVELDDPLVCALVQSERLERKSRVYPVTVAPHQRVAADDIVIIRERVEGSGRTRSCKFWDGDRDLVRVLRSPYK